MDEETMKEMLRKEYKYSRMKELIKLGLKPPNVPEDPIITALLRERRASYRAEHEKVELKRAELKRLEGEIFELSFKLAFVGHGIEQTYDELDKQAKALDAMPEEERRALVVDTPEHREAVVRDPGLLARASIQMFRMSTPQEKAALLEEARARFNGTRA